MDILKNPEDAYKVDGKPYNYAGLDFAVVDYDFTPFDISETGGLCASYTSDNPVKLEIRDTEEKSDEWCYVTLRAAKEPTTVDFSTKDFIQPSWTPSDKKIDCTKAFESARRINLKVEGGGKDVKGILRVFSVGPKGTCISKEILENEPMDFCFRGDGRGKAKEQNDCFAVNEIPSHKAYSITFVYGEHKTATFVDDGEMPVVPEDFNESELCPENTDEFTYFCGWDPKISAATADVTYEYKIDSSNTVYKVSAKASDEKLGSVSGLIATGEYGYGETVKISAVANKGAEFVKWSDGVENATRSIVVKSDSSFVAEFVVIYEITFVYGDKTKKITVKDGVMPSVPDDFDESKLCPENSSEYTYSCDWNPKISKATADVKYEYKVNKAKVLYQVSAKASEEKMGSVKGLSESGEYEYGASVEIKAVPNKDYEFVKWTDGVKKATRTVVVKSDTSFVAEFQKATSEEASTKDSSKTDTKKDSTEVAKKDSSKTETKKDSSKTEPKKDGKKESILALSGKPLFSVMVYGRSVLVSGVSAGSSYAVFDMLGGFVKGGVTDNVSFNVDLPRAGNYLVRVGNQVQKVNVR